MLLLLNPKIHDKSLVGQDFTAREVRNVQRLHEAYPRLVSDTFTPLKEALTV